MKNTILRSISLTVLLSIIVLLVGCPKNAEDAADAVFKTKGLNRLRIINDQIKVGSVILVKDGKAAYADNITDYHKPGEQPKISSDASNSVISDFGANTNMNASAAVDFLTSFLPVSADGKINFSTSVKLDQIYAQTHRIQITKMNQYLGSSQAQEFRDEMTAYMNQGYKVYISYEDYQSNKIKITSTSGSDISSGVNVGEVKPIFSGVNTKISYTKNSNMNLNVDGSTYYTFALRTAKLVKQGNLWTIQPGNFFEKGHLAAGDKKYSYSPLSDNQTDFPVLDLTFGKPPLIP